MRSLSVSSLAAVTLLSLAACGGSDDTGSRPALAPGDIGEPTVLSAPVETGPEQLARGQDIFARADSLIMSTWYAEMVYPDRIARGLILSECSGSECTLLEPITGATQTARIETSEASLGDPEPVGSAHGITLMSESAHEMDLDLTSFGAWMEHGSFGARGAGEVNEEPEITMLYTTAGGDLTDRPPTGTASWLGLMVGTPVAGDDRGDRLVGTAALEYGLDAGGLDAAFSGIANIDCGTPHCVGTVTFSGLAVGPDGTFARGEARASRAASTVPITPRRRASSSSPASSAPSARSGSRRPIEGAAL